MKAWRYTLLRPAVACLLGPSVLSSASFSAAAALLLAAQAQAEGIDAVQWRLAQQLPVSVRWDALSQPSPYLLAGQTLNWRNDGRYPKLQLQAGQSLRLHLPRGEYLRIQSTAQDVAKLSVWSNQANRLAVRETLHAQDEGFLLQKDSDAARIIELHAAKDAAIELAIFVSRQAELAELAPYRQVLALIGVEQGVRAESMAAPESYWPLSPSHTQSLRVRGPARLALHTRWQSQPQDTMPTQTWQVALSGVQEKTIEFDFQGQAEHGELLWLNGVPSLLSDVQSAYFNLPAGEHQLSLRSNGPLLVRLLQQEANDYVFAERNAGLDLAAAQVGNPLGTGLPTPADWTNDANAFNAARQTGEPEQIKQAAIRLQQDNRHREGSLIAANLLRAHALATGHEFGPLKQAEQAVLQSQSRWQDVLPSSKLRREPPRLAWYATHNLLPLGTRANGNIIAAQHAEQLLAGLQLGHFLPLPNDDQAQLYHLPARHADSQIQIALHVARETQQNLWLQFDNAAPREIKLSAAPAADTLANSNALSALQWQSVQHPEFAGSTTDAAFSKHATPAPLLAARVLNLALPRHVQQIKIWRGVDEDGAQFEDIASANQMWLGLKLRSAQPFSLAENNLLAMLKDGDGLASLQAALATPTSSSALDSHLQPLLRMLRSQADLFASSVSKPLPTPSKPAANPAEKQAEEQSKRAQQLANEGNWLAALEQWREIPSDCASSICATSLQGRINALLALGEHFLAEQLLKQHVLYGQSALATQKLAQLYAEAADTRSMLSLAASNFLRQPEAAQLLPLVDALQADQHTELALQAALFLPAKQRPLENMLNMAQQLQKWPTLSAELRASLPSRAAREFWQAQQLAQEMQFAAAKQSFEISALLATQSQDTALAQQAKQFAAHLQQGLQLHHSLRSVDKASASAQNPLPPALLDAWAQWQAQHPGPLSWQELAGQVQDYAGAVSLYSMNRDIASTSYRSQAGQPVKVRVLGPMRLRVEARPLHAANSQQALEGWLKIEEKTRQMLWPVPILQNWPATGLTLVGNTAEVPGQMVTREIELDAGWHDLEISGAQLALLINLKTALPALRLPVLPLLNQDSLRAQAKPTLTMLDKQREWLTMLSACKGCSSVLLPTALSGAAEATQIMRWRSEAMPSADFANPTPISSQPAPTSAKPSLAQMLGQQAWPQILAAPVGTTPNAVLETLSALLWQHEHATKTGANSEWQQAGLALASQIQAEHPELRTLGGLMERFTRNSEWVLQHSVQSSAGQRSRAIQSWEPEAPAMRVRRALLPPLQPQEYVLSAGNRLVLSFFNLKAGQLRLRLAKHEVGALPAQALTAQVQLDKGPIQTITLNQEGQAIHLPLTLKKGEQSLKVWIKNSVTQQFLSVLVTENSAQSANKMMDSSERFYHVARHQEPIKLVLAGPVWLRLDHWRNGQTHSRYRLLKEKSNTLILKPRADESEALFRIFTRQIGTEKPVTPTRQIAVPMRPVAAPLFEAATTPTILPRFEASSAGPAALELGGQEAGTISVYASVLQKTSMPNDARPHSGGKAKDGAHEAPANLNSIETGASFRLYDAVRHNWYRADVFVRRAPQQNALGAVASLRHDPAWQGVLLGAEASALWQSKHHKQAAALTLGGQAFIKQNREISPTLSHQPRLALVLRQGVQASDAALLSADKEVANSPGVAAKRNLSTEVSENIQYRPRLDTMLSAQAKLSSGASFLPSVLSTQFSAKQMYGNSTFGLHVDASFWRENGRRLSAGDTRSLTFSSSTDIWLPQQQRLEIGLHIKRDLLQHRTSGGIGVVLHFGNGRGYRDFQPEEIMFRSLRQRKAPEPLHFSNSALATLANTPSSPSADAL